MSNLLFWQPAESALQEDVSLKMKRRAFAGYGIDFEQVRDVIFTTNLNTLGMLNYLVFSFDNLYSTISLKYFIVPTSLHKISHYNQPYLN